MSGQIFLQNDKIKNLISFRNMKHQDNLIEITFEIELLAVLEVQNKLEKSFI